MTILATGTFEVNLTPQPPGNQSQPAAISRMLIEKQFHGDLEAVSQGQMLAASTAVDDSAGYVAVEQVSGTLNGRSGTFMLQHSGIMNRGTPHLSITVVPDSGAGKLVGLTGEMTIHINEGRHLYELIYTLPDT